MGHNYNDHPPQKQLKKSSKDITEHFRKEAYLFLLSERKIDHSSICKVNMKLLLAAGYFA